MRIPIWLILVAGNGFAATTRADVATYTLDPTHTRIAFRVSHAGFSHALGTFEGATGTLAYDEDDPTSAKLELTLAVSSLDLGEDDWNRKVLDGTFFDAKAWPQARFVSTAVAATDKPNVLRVRGDLTIHGVTRPVEFDATVNAVKRHPLTFKRTAGFSAVLTVSRKAFGMGAWPGVVGDEVEILVELEATRARSGDTQAPLPGPPLRDAQGREINSAGETEDTQRSDDEAAPPADAPAQSDPTDTEPAEADDGAAA